ncbi:hypothetical protein DDD_3186 [Nonlabens dokdonensis DSW-6]|uniref:Uncharacterized protein n=1 Tax=Nonlabens dokdonensis (strain DSM 17205 / KCTC 12402 / DSW-6) TaxID=592029 RepID=L7WH81_NONDD|nr:hypothetical protein DDD_3186 [Nonlabens dokdonensis DSW-6]
MSCFLLFIGLTGFSLFIINLFQVRLLRFRFRESGKKTSHIPFLRNF